MFKDETPSWIKDDFATIFEASYSNGFFDEDFHYNDRDNFLEYYEGELSRGNISAEEFASLFERQPNIPSVDGLKVLALASATCELVFERNAAKLDFASTPEWATRWTCEEDDPLFLHGYSSMEFFRELIAETPEACRKRNIYAYPRDFTYR